MAEPSASEAPPNFQTARGAEWVVATVPVRIRDRWRSLEDLTGV
jgi:hypothetical protein